MTSEKRIRLTITAEYTPNLLDYDGKDPIEVDRENTDNGMALAELLEDCNVTMKWEYVEDQ